MPIARRSSRARDLMLILVFCLFHAAFPEVLQPASSLEGASVRIGWRANALQFFCSKVQLSTRHQAPGERGRTTPGVASLTLNRRRWFSFVLFQGKQSTFHQLRGVIKSLSGVDCFDRSLSKMVTAIQGRYGVNLPSLITQLIRDAIVA